MKKVLIITYYWPPAGGPGVQRVLKFAKYLPEFGWQPIILTVKNGEYPAIDETLVEEIPECCKVYKTNSIEPSFLYKKFTGMSSDEAIPVATLTEKKTSWKMKLAHWIRLNLFIPDAKIGWIPFAVKEGKRIIKKEKPDLIFSSSPPPTVHLIAKKLAKSSKIKWVADFRDPWTEIHYYENQERNKISQKLDSKYEKEVLNNVSVITTTSQLYIEDDFAQKVSSKKCINIPNGYDEEDFKVFDYKQKNQNKEFTILHLGAVGKERIPYNLLKCIRELIDSNKIKKELIRVIFIGNVEESFKKIVKGYNLTNLIRFIKYLPHYDAIEMATRSDILLLLITQSENNRRILPGKTFEYLRLNKPILALGPEDGEVARILIDSKMGKVLDYNNEVEISKVIADYYNSWESNTIKHTDKIKFIEKYNRKNLTEQLVKIFEEK